MSILGSWDFLDKEIAKKAIRKVFNTAKSDLLCPSLGLVFRAFQECSPDNFKALILGQDPYPQKGVADGLAFSCGITKVAQPSLGVIHDDIFKNGEEPGSEFGIDDVVDLTPWAKQGLLLLNSSMTCQVNMPGSHIDVWDEWTKHAIEKISDTYPNAVYAFFGNQAKQYVKYCKANNIIQAPHPVTETYGTYNWSDRGYMTTINELIEKSGRNKIDWHEK